MPGIPKSSSSSASTADKGVYSSRGSISRGNWGQLLFVCIASPSLGQATISLAHSDGVSLVSFITASAGSAEDTYERNPEHRRPPGVSRGMLIITRVRGEMPRCHPQFIRPISLKSRTARSLLPPPDLVFLQLAPWAVRRTIPSLRCTHK